MTAKMLVVLGTSSSVGKSLLVTGLCRSFARQGVRVAPFKAQNMSNNAAVCPDGAEIGRAQATQALACGLDPHVDMNPVLIKPEADSRSQIVVNGRAWKTLDARQYYPKTDFLWEQATAALDRLRQEYELIIVEGAGSAAELNLKEGDIVNMAVARYAAAPVLLAGDIDRGGIFAQLLGTLWLLEPEERDLLKGFIVNKFRGDATLFSDGIRILEEKSDLPVLGVVPYLHDLFIPEEDAVALENPSEPTADITQTVDIVVLRLPRIANFDDFDPLAAEPGVQLRYVDNPAQLGDPDAIIIPGTKSTMDDLSWLRAQGFDRLLHERVRAGVSVVGICGGYQILGQALHDPQQVESQLESAPGLGLLPVETTFLDSKATHQAGARIHGGPGWLKNLQGQSVSGYEIHMGRTPSQEPWLQITRRGDLSVELMDGAVTQDGKVWGCYMHALFANHNLRRAWLRDLGWTGAQAAGDGDPFLASLERLADTLESSLDMPALEKIIWEN